MSLNVLVSQYNAKIEKKAEKSEIKITFFNELPIELQIVALCESNAKSEAISDTRDIGIMQINEKAHKEKAARIGLDIFDTNENMAYGKYLYEHNGLTPWLASASCWTDKIEMKKRS